MRVSKTKQNLSVRAIAGLHVVILAWSLPKTKCTGLMGFAIHRTDHTEDEAYYLEGMKVFTATDPHLARGSLHSTRQQPIQSFGWSDYTAKPGHRYTYRVEALYGPPDNLEVKRSVAVEVKTEQEEVGAHTIYFNRGAAASQEYMRRFDHSKPLGDIPKATDPRWAWLSRGAAEAIQQFARRASGPNWSLRVCAYEFRWGEFAACLKEVADLGVDVRIVYDCNSNPPETDGSIFPRDKNRTTASDAGIQTFCTERITRSDIKSPPISHNKFIVLLKKGVPQAVLTGSTNFSVGGVYGQSNAVHIFDNKAAAAAYHDLWKLLAGNPKHNELRDSLTTVFDIPDDQPDRGTHAVFSPRNSLAALDWYAKLAKESEDAIFMTFAFGMNKLFKDAFANGSSRLRFALMDKLLSPGVRKDKREAAEAEMLAIRKLPEVRIAVGNRLTTNAFDNWLRERLTGLNSNVQYIHTKFMLLNPLSDDPVVIAGSANFSDASTDSNDENMLVIRGDKRVADIYLGEYMRLWNHYAFREWVANKAEGQELKPLDPDSRWWRSYFGKTQQSSQRQYFSGIEAS